MLGQTFRYTTITVSLIAMIAAFVFLGSGESTQSTSFAKENAAAAQAQEEKVSMVGRLVTEKAAYQRLDFEAPVLNALQASDLSLPDSFTVTFEMSIPTVRFDPDQGTTICECKLTYQNGVRGLSVESPLTNNLTYRAPGTAGYQDIDYDEEGNLLIWHSARKVCLSAGDVNRAFDEQELFRIHPDGTVVLDHVHPQTYEYRVGSENNVHEFEKFRLATGRGFSKHLRALNSEIPLQDPVQMFDVQGVLGASLTGAWEISVDEDADHLVREAVFWSDNMADHPAVRVEAYGDIIDGSDPVIASAGTIEYDHGGDGQTYLVEINVLDYSTAVDEEHLTSLRQRLVDELPEAVEVVDFRTPVPQRYSSDAH
ncbi:MAG: hypothetical protein MI923_22580 [Phycisphaerales bacterium]|nr:hypothetical protein [Phycisphaerales bacterium]